MVAIHFKNYAGKFILITTISSALAARIIETIEFPHLFEFKDADPNNLPKLPYQNPKFLRNSPWRGGRLTFE